MPLPLPRPPNTRKVIFIAKVRDVPGVSVLPTYLPMSPTHVFYNIKKDNVKIQSYRIKRFQTLCLF